MVNPIRISLDAMGGDFGVDVCVPAALRLARQRGELSLILVGQAEKIEPLTQGFEDVASRVRIVDAREVVGMDESPLDALRKKKNSSLRVATDLVRQGEANACVSAGNTGALMATGRFVLKTLPGISRPAIMTAVPTMQGRVHMLDVGANADCTPENLFQFAVMGSVVASEIEDILQPRIGLLNIGVEDIKGNDSVREAAMLLGASALNYIGFIEGNAIFEQKADVVVCDGFSGNVALKSMEGTSQLITHYLRQEFNSGFYGKLAGMIARPVLNSLTVKLDPRRYNGASLVGLNGIVIKSHGGADQVAFQQAIQTAMIEVEKAVPDQIRKMLEKQAG